MPGKVLRSDYWQNLSSSDLLAIDAQSSVALLPVAAVEQHGPHLPLGTDAFINEALVAEALQQVSDDVQLLVLPAMTIGDSLEHSEFAGTLSIESNTLLNSWLDVGRSVADTGLRKLIILNSHGGQLPLIDMAALRLRQELKMLVARVSSFRLGVPAGLFDVDELAHGLHGGEVETSLMMHLRPQLVRYDELRNFDSLSAQWAREGRLLGVEKPAGIGWMAQDINEHGVCGNAAAADAQRGALLQAHMVTALCQIVVEMAATPLDVVRNRI